MMKIIDKRNWQPSDNILLEESAFQAVTSQNNILVIAGPGAGISSKSYLSFTNKSL